MRRKKKWSRVMCSCLKWTSEWMNSLDLIVIECNLWIHDNNIQLTLKIEVIFTFRASFRKYKLFRFFLFIAVGGSVFNTHLSSMSSRQLLTSETRNPVIEEQPHPPCLLLPITQFVFVDHLQNVSPWWTFWHVIYHLVFSIWVTQE